jgi:hypothetical protein
MKNPATIRKNESRIPHTRRHGTEFLHSIATLANIRHVLPLAGRDVRRQIRNDPPMKTITLALAAVAALALTSCAGMGGATFTGSYTTKEGATFSGGVTVPPRPSK